MARSSDRINGEPPVTVSQLPPPNASIKQFESLCMSSFGALKKPENLKEQQILRKTFGNPALKRSLYTKNLSSFHNSHYKSNFNDHFMPDFDDILRNIEMFTVDDFTDSFYGYVSVENNHISALDIPKIIPEVMGEHTPQWIIKKFTTLAVTYLNYNKRISWDDFSKCIPLVFNAVKVDCQKVKHVKPQWASTAAATTSKSTSSLHIVTDDNDVALQQTEQFELATHSPTSHYRLDHDASRFGQKEYCDDFPKNSATTKLMFGGTSKSTDQLPKYAGHVPLRMSSSPMKEKHGNRSYLKHKPTELRLTTPGLGSVPGYTGTGHVCLYVTCVFICDMCVYM